MSCFFYFSSVGEKNLNIFLEIALFIDFSELKYILCIFQNASTFSGGKGKILSEWWKIAHFVSWVAYFICSILQKKIGLISF